MMRMEYFQRLGLLGFIVLMGAFFSVMSPYFLTWENIANILVRGTHHCGRRHDHIAAQLDILENMVAKKYDAIVAHSITRHNLIPGLVKAKQKGIPAITDSIRVDMKAAKEAF